MSYYHAKTLKGLSFEEAVEKTKVALKTQGFGVLSEIDIQGTLKEKIGVDFRKYRILGACNPGFAHKALSAEDKIGVFLPCNVIVQELANGDIEVAAVDPVASMVSVKNPALEGIASEVQSKIATAVAAI